MSKQTNPKSSAPVRGKYSKSIDRLLNPDTWLDGDDTVRNIDSMNAHRLTNLIDFLERRFTVSAEDWRTLEGMGIDNIFATPLMQSLASRLPIAADEEMRRILTKAGLPRNRPIDRPLNRKAEAKGQTLDQISQAGKPKTVRAEDLEKEAAKLPTSSELRHETQGASATEAVYTTGEVAALLSIERGTVHKLIQQGRLLPVAGGDRLVNNGDREYRIPQSEVARYIRERQAQVTIESVPEGWISVKEAAIKINCTEAKVKSLIKSEHLNGMKDEVNGHERWRVTLRSVEDFKIRERGIGEMFFSDAMKDQTNAISQEMARNTLRIVHAIQEANGKKGSVLPRNDDVVANWLRAWRKRYEAQAEASRKGESDATRYRIEHARISYDLVDSMLEDYKEHATVGAPLDQDIEGA